MARAQVSDYLTGMRFFVTTPSANYLPAADNYLAEGAGFQAVTTPEMTQDAVEYREGTWVYTRKYPGVPTMSDVTLSRGMTHKDTTFFDWASRAITGDEYRADVVIYHLHRKDVTRQTGQTDGSTNKPSIDLDSSKQYKLYEAFPIRCKIAGDLDSTTGDVSIGELDVSYEYFEVKPGE